VRSAILARHEAEAEDARNRIKLRPGFEKLKPEQSHSVLRPLADAPFVTNEDAVAPSLGALLERFPGRLGEKIEEANVRLDEELESLLKKPVRPVQLPLHGRELESRAQLKTLLDEIEDQLAPLLDQNVRVRLT
jgi:hypothetical protein